MTEIAVQFLDQGLHRVLFDAMPMPVFVVDEDVSLLEYNAAAARLLGDDKQPVLHRRGGDVLHCLQALEAPGGCGRASACADCVVRQAVQSALSGHPITRAWTSLETSIQGRCRVVDLRVTARSFTYGRQTMVLLILEGLND
jgi:PAS domain-containing protein